ncbi:cell division control protein [Entomortierella chlamydospora]|uniref:Cell division control protein n=1 Tax=Entomortierella chlamydospora TaxID=101097 RepID=A0A9P6N281_9FUNG|nr:cell division control protein [Entomortierella chlamydospora]
MVVGESGLGKTTFMNTLFNADLKEEIPTKKLHSTQTVQIQPSYYELIEDGVLLNLCIVDTPGFGDELNRERNLTPIIEYIDQQYAEYMKAERQPGFRKSIPDTRVHAVLYFLAPTGHGLKELDVKALRTLSQKVNVIPVIAKADTMTAEEKIAFKSLLLRDFEEYRIDTFPSSHLDEVDGAEELLVGHTNGNMSHSQLLEAKALQSLEAEECVPALIVGASLKGSPTGSFQDLNINGNFISIVENAEHSDFIYLRELLLETCLHDLVESTHRVHYHDYRAKALRTNNRVSFYECDESYDSHLENSKKAKADMERREEEIRQKFIEKVHETELALREREEQLMAKKMEMVAELDQYKALLEAEIREVDELEAISRNNTMSKNSSKSFRSK